MPSYNEGYCYHLVSRLSAEQFQKELALANKKPSWGSKKYREALFSLDNFIRAEIRKNTVSSTEQFFEERARRAVLVPKAPKKSVGQLLALTAITAMDFESLKTSDEAKTPQILEELNPTEEGL